MNSNTDSERAFALLEDPRRNKGTAFSKDERRQHCSPCDPGQAYKQRPLGTGRLRRFIGTGEGGLHGLARRGRVDAHGSKVSMLSSNASTCFNRCASGDSSTMRRSCMVCSP